MDKFRIEYYVAGEPGFEIEADGFHFGTSGWVIFYEQQGDKKTPIAHVKSDAILSIRRVSTPQLKSAEGTG